VGIVVVPVVPRAAATAVDITEAVRLSGHEPVFVGAAGVLDEGSTAAHTAFGPVVECDPDDPSAAVEELRRHRPIAITTFSEGMVRLTSVLAEELGLPFHDRVTVDLLTNKWTQRQRLAQEGVDTVESVLVLSRAAMLAAVASVTGRAGAAVVKPMVSQSSRDSYLVTGDGGLPEDLVPSDERPFVVEEYLRGRDEGEFGDYVSVEGLVVAGTPVTLGITGKYPLLPPFREQGQFYPTHVPPADQEAVGALAAAAARALGVRHGLLHTEIKLTADGPRIIEVNGRLGGFMGELYRRGAGRDLLALAVAEACGHPVEPLPPAVESGVHFQFFNTPPPEGGILRRVDGAEAVRAEPGVLEYLPQQELGTELAPGVMTAQLDMIRAVAPDHVSMLKIIDQVLAHLRFEIEDQDGVVRVWCGSRDGLCLIG
jgi:hypothetical protein